MFHLRERGGAGGCAALEQKPLRERAQAVRRSLAGNGPEAQFCFYISPTASGSKKA